MSEKAKRANDAFAFSLGGMKAISSFCIAPAIADDRINKVRDARFREIQEDHPGRRQEYSGIKGRFWILGRRRVA